MKPPIAWHGGKSRFATTILAKFPDHQTYVEPFGGSGSVLFAKTLSPVEVFNDLDEELVTLYRVIRDHRLCRCLKKLCERTLYSRAEFNLALEPTDDPVERARRFLVRQNMSYSGLGLRWSYSVQNSSRGMASVVRRWASIL